MTAHSTPLHLARSLGMLIVHAPSEAPLWGQLQVLPGEVLVSGEKRIVFLDMGDGRLKPVSIRTGYSDGEHVVVRRGLQEGDKIVTSGNFLIAAESKLKTGGAQW